LERQTTASDSVLVAVVAARSRYQRLHPDVSLKDLIIYTTTQTHSCGLKAGLNLGIEVRAIEVDAHNNYALCGSELNKALESDVADGKHPFVLSEYPCIVPKSIIDLSFFAVATLGSTSSGASDNMSEIRDVGELPLPPTSNSLTLTTIHFSQKLS
jgi:aromatic-L-amino-acid decarboxylase